MSDNNFDAQKDEIRGDSVNGLAEELEIAAPNDEFYQTLRESVSEATEGKINRKDVFQLQQPENQPITRQGLLTGIAGAKAYLEHWDEDVEVANEALIERFENSGDFSQRYATDFDDYRSALVDGFVTASEEENLSATRANGEGAYVDAAALGANAVAEGFNNAPEYVDGVDDWEDLLEM